MRVEVESSFQKAPTHYACEAPTYLSVLGRLLLALSGHCFGLLVAKVHQGDLKATSSERDRNIATNL
jgi:hypothetical protein